MSDTTRKNKRPWERGTALVEMAIAFPLLLLAALGLVQFALYVHAENVVIGSVQDGARVAAENNRSLSDGVATARSLLQAGLGPDASSVGVQGSDDGTTVTIAASGSLATALPGLAIVPLPLKAEASIDKETFVVGPGG